MWGNVRWLGSPPPWEKTKVLCPLCDHWPRGTPHARLVQCGAWSAVFFREWVQNWGPWDDLARQWLREASSADLDHISKLRVPQSPIDTMPGSNWATYFSGRVAPVSHDARHYAAGPVTTHASIPRTPENAMCQPQHTDVVHQTPPSR